MLTFYIIINFQNSPEMDFFSDYGDANRYKIQEIIGRGSYGVVCSAIDQQTGEKVAIKKIKNIFEHLSDATRILREIKLLRLLRHPDIVEIKHVMLPPSRRDFRDIYVVFELMDTDLHQVIKANDDLTKEHNQFFLYQMLRALKYIHTGMHIHEDLYFGLQGLLSSLHSVMLLPFCFQLGIQMVMTSLHTNFTLVSINEDGFFCIFHS
jgi:serine/threonine protein kinase